MRFPRLVIAVLAVLLASSLGNQPRSSTAASVRATAPVSVSYQSGDDVIAVSATGSRLPDGAVQASITITAKKTITYVLGFGVQGQITAPWFRKGASFSTFESVLLGGSHVTLPAVRFSPGSKLTITADKWAKYIHGRIRPIIPMAFDFGDALVRCTTGSSVADFMNNGFAKTASSDLAQAFAARLDGIGIAGSAIAAYLATPNKDWKGAFSALLTTASSHPIEFGKLLRQVLHAPVTQSQLSRFLSAAPLLGCVVSLPEFAFDVASAPQLRRVTVTASQGQQPPGEGAPGGGNGWPTNGTSTATVRSMVHGGWRTFQNGTGAAVKPVAESRTAVSIRIPRGVGTLTFTALALYRTWAAPHWLEIEDVYSALDCQGPWLVNGALKQIFYFPGATRYQGLAPLAPPPRGQYHLAMLYAHDSAARPYARLYAILSNQSYALPLADKDKHLTVFTCPMIPGSNAPCTSPTFKPIPRYSIHA